MPRRKPNTGTVLVRKNGRVAVILPPDLDPSRRPVYSSAKRRPFESVAQATLWLDAKIWELRHPTPRVTGRRMALGEYLARWYADHEPGWPPRTARAYKHALRRWAGIGGVALEDLTREVVQRATADLQRATWTWKDKHGKPTSEPKPYSRRTIEQARNVLHQALEDLVPDVLQHNPARSRRRSRQAAEPEQPVWTQEQSDRFLDVAERTVPELALAFRLILRRALRIGEAISLQWSDLDATRGVLVVDETADDHGESSGPTKTRRTRDIPLSADLLARMRTHAREYPSTSPHVFRHGGRRVSFYVFRHAWDRVVTVARLPRIAPKDGRATCATNLLDAGVPLPQVAGLLGHTSVAVTARFYARTLRRRQEAIAALGESLDRALNANSPADDLAASAGLPS